MVRTQLRPPLARNRNWVVFWVGSLFSSVGTWTHNVAASVLIYQMTESSLMVGLLQACNFGPVLVLSMAGGVLSDRFDRRVLVSATYGTAFVAAVGLGVLTVGGLIRPWSLLGFVAVLGSTHALAKPTMSAMIPDLVVREDISRASASNVLQFNLGQVIGSTLATVFLLSVGPGFAFVVNGATFLAPVAAAWWIGAPLKGARSSTGGGMGAALDGARYVREEPRMLWILGAIVCVNGVMESLRTLAPGLAEVALGESAEVAGVLVGASSTGSIVALMLFSPVQRSLSPRQLLYAGFASLGVGAVTVGTATALPVAVGGGLVIGFGFALLIPLLNAGLQELSSDAFRGRVMATFSMAHLGARPAWAVGAGAVAAIVTPGVALSVFGLSAIGGMLAVKGIRANVVAGEVVMEPEEAIPRRAQVQ